MLFRMVPKPMSMSELANKGFRAVLFRMVPKPQSRVFGSTEVLELCCFEWFQNTS